MKLSDHYMANLFRYEHLNSAELRKMSQGFAETANEVISGIPDEVLEQNVELADTLIMKLWEAKNLAVVLLALKDEEDDE